MIGRLLLVLACGAATSILTGVASQCIAQQDVPDWVAQIRPDHPRLFFNADTWPQVRERALTVHNDYYDAMKLHAETEPKRGWWNDKYTDPDLIPVPAPRPGCKLDARDWGPQALSNAFIYCMEPSPERLERVRDMLWASLDYYHACYAADKSVSWYSYSRLAWLAALDWVWNDIDPQERAEMGRSILRHADEVLHKPGIASRGTAGHTACYYGGRNMTFFTGLLLHNEGIDDEAATEMLLEGWGVYEKLLPYRAEIVGDDGAALSPSVTYAFADCPEAEWSLIYALRSAAGVDIPAQWHHIAMMPNYVIWNYIPPGFEFGYGSVHHATNRFPAGMLDIGTE